MEIEKGGKRVKRRAKIYASVKAVVAINGDMAPGSYKERVYWGQSHRSRYNSAVK